MKRNIFLLFIILLLPGINKALAQSSTFNYTGSMQTYSVSVTRTIAVDMAGAQGGNLYNDYGVYESSYYNPQTGGYGGRVVCLLAVTAGQVLHINVGGNGQTQTAASPAAGGYNGGGTGSALSTLVGGGGGGASDIAIGSTPVAIAGGGGGAGFDGDTSENEEGGPGGGLTGGSGHNNGFYNPLYSGGGGTQSSGGTSPYGTPGSFEYQGGNGSTGNLGGGGGGGYYGGGGGYLGGGGGGSSYTNGSYAIAVTHTQGYQPGNGYVIISCSAPAITVSSPEGFSFCNGSGSTELTASGSDGTVAGSGTYTWMPATGLSNTAGATVSSVAPPSTTTYTVTGTTLGGCSSTATVTVTVNQTPDPISVPSAVCAGSEISVTENIGGGNFSLSPGDAAYATITTGGEVTGESEGIPTVTYTLPTGCYITAPVTVNAVAGITSATSAASPICPSGSTNITANGVVGTAASLTWWTGAGGTGTNLGSSNPLSVGPGTYYADVTGICGATAEASVTIDANTNVGITSATTAASPICSFLTTTLTANGVSGSDALVTWYTGSDGTGANLGTANPLTAGPGTYYAYVTGDCGTAQASVTVGTATYPGVPTVVATVSSVCPGGTTTITASDITGTGATLTWWAGGVGTGTNLGSANPLTVGPGTYTAFVNAACSAAEASVTVGSNTNAGITSATAAASPICPSGSTNITANGVVGTGASLTWWTGAGGTGTNLGSSNPLSVGTGTYYADVTGTCGATAETSVTVDAYTNVGITSATAAASPICSFLTTTLTANGVSGSDALVTWYTGSDGTGANLGTANPLTGGPGTYYAYVTGDCGTAQASVTVGTATYPGVPTVVATVSSVCPGGTTTVTASDITGTGATLTWWAGGVGTGTNLGSANPITVGPGTYTAFVNAACSAAETSVTIGTSVLPTVSISSSNNLTCTTTSATLTASGAATYTWSGSSSASSSRTVTTAGAYTVTGTGSDGCSASAIYSETLTTTPLAAPTVTVTNNCGSSTLTAAGIVSGAIVTWSPAGSGNPLIVTSSGSYTATQSLSGCTSSASAAVTAAPGSGLTLTPTISNVSCRGGSNGSISVVATGSSGFYTYSWSPCGSSSASITGKTAGTYTVTVTNGSCHATGVYTITQPSAALAMSGTVTNVTCNGGNNGSITSTVTGGTPSYTYSWSPCSGAAATLTGKAAGTYDVTVTDAHGCTSTKAYTITQPAALGLTAAVTNASCTGCSNGSINTTVCGGTPAYTYAWSDGLHIADPTALAAATYTVTVTDAKGCTIKGAYIVAQPAKGKSGGRTSGETSNPPSGINVTVIPNPNNGTFTIKGTMTIRHDEEVAIRIVNMLGQVIYNSTVITQNGELNQQVQLNGGIANGMYILTLSSGDQSNAFHIVVEQ